MVYVPFEMNAKNVNVIALMKTSKMWLPFTLLFI